MDLRAINALVCETFTPERVKQIANVGHPLLADIPRMEEFTGASLRIGRLEIRRACDYEIVRFCGDAPWESVRSACHDAITALGARMESCLEGKPIARTFSQALHGEEPSDGGIDTPRATWQHACLYSLGPVPRLLNPDIVIHTESSGKDHQIRFGYYANTGPRMWQRGY